MGTVTGLSAMRISIIILLLLLLFVPANAQFIDVTDATENSTVTSDGLVMSGLTGSQTIKHMYQAVQNQFTVPGRFKVGILDDWHPYPDSSTVENGDTVYLQLDVYGKSTQANMFISIGWELYDVWSVTTVENITPSVWYVDKDAAGSGNGTSWTNAFTSFGNDFSVVAGRILWEFIGGGDTIYVSGGSENKQYPPSISRAEKNAFKPVNFTEPVIVTNGKDAEHNGIAEFYNTTAGASSFTSGGISNVKFKDLLFTVNVEPHFASTVTKNVSIAYDSLITFESCEFKTNGMSGALTLDFVSKLTADSCYFNIQENAYPYDQDFIFQLFGRGGHTITNNRFMYRNSYCNTEGSADASVTYTPTSLTDTRQNMIENYHQFSSLLVGDIHVYIDSNSANTFYVTDWDGEATPDNGTAYTVRAAHRDQLQLNTFGNDPLGTGEKLTTVIANNILLFNSPQMTEVSGMIYSSNQNGNQNWLIYNNILANASRRSDGLPIWILNSSQPTNPVSQSMLIFNNTIISKYTSVGLNFRDSVLMKNNLFIADSAVNYSLQFAFNEDDFASTYKDFDYNIYAERGGYTDPFTSGSETLARTWAEWQALNQDVNSNTMDAANVTFTDVYSENVADYYTETGRDIGVNLYNEYPFLRYDILGNARPESGTWDIGALEYQGEGGATPSAKKMG